jgi:hypothetical protein
MWRAFFMAVGIFMVILGAQFLIVEKMVMAEASKSHASSESHAASSHGGGKNNDFKPGEGLPWILLSAGTVIIIYTFTIPKRVAAQTHPS